MPDNYWFAIGYYCINNFAFRVDVFERIFYLARQKNKFGPFIESSDLMNPIGCNSEQLSNLLNFCGFESTIMGDGKRIFYIKTNKAKNEKNQKLNINLKHKKNKASKKVKSKKIDIRPKSKKNWNLTKWKKILILLLQF